MNRIRIEIPGTPQAKQSTRFSGRLVGDKVFVRAYQKSSVVKKGHDLANEIRSQIPNGFEIFDGVVGVVGCYIFPPPKHFSKKKIAQVERGYIFYKGTKPDLHDNLNKQLFDAMEGIVFTNDSRVCKIGGFEKIYGIEPKTIVEVFIIKDGEHPAFGKNNEIGMLNRDISELKRLIRKWKEKGSPAYGSPNDIQGVLEFYEKELEEKRSEVLKLKSEIDGRFS